MRDLVCLVADKNMAAALEGLLNRPRALGIRAIQSETIVHPRRDPGCFHEPIELLRGYRADTGRAVVLLDRAWDGAPEGTAEDIEELIRGKLCSAGLGEWAEVVVIDPELEVWVFSDSPHVEEILGWTRRHPSLRPALESGGLWTSGAPKPLDPKAALDWALHAVRKPRSSSIYRLLAECVGLERCQDRSFLRLKDILRQWFGTERDAGG